MKVFNPGQVPVPVDDGVIVPANDFADVKNGERVRQCIDSRQLVDKTEPEHDAAESAEPKARHTAPKGDPK